MTRRIFGGLALATLGLVLGGQGTASAADEKVATGTWTWKYMRPGADQAVEVTLKLKQDGEKLTGTITGPNNTKSDIKEGSVKKGEVEFKVDRERNGETFTIQYSGKLDGDTIKGKSESTFNGNTRSRDWEAKRVAETAK